MIAGCEKFGVTQFGEPIYAYTMKNKDTMSVTVINYGATVLSIKFNDKIGKARELTLGYDILSGYEMGSCYFGAFVGRYANRIADAAFELGGKMYKLNKNDGANHLHGILSKRVFDAKIADGGVKMSITSPNGEDGFPGNVDIDVFYKLEDDNSLLIEYTAVSDVDTVCNLTNHTYFNLDGAGDILNHILCLKSDVFTQIKEGLLPTGKSALVHASPMDFRIPRKIGEALDEKYSQIKIAGGYDHNYILSDTSHIKSAGYIYSSDSGIKMSITTTQPGVQVYSGNFVDTDTAANLQRKRYPKYGGIAIETQHFPDSPNNPQFPSTILKAGKTYRESTRYLFEII